MVVASFVNSVCVCFSLVSVLPECVLVIAMDPQKFQAVSEAVFCSLAKEYSVDEEHVHDWASLVPVPLSLDYMIHYFADIASHLR